MQRRSFFGVVFGGLVATRLPPIKRRLHQCQDRYGYRFGFTGFKPADEVQGTLDGDRGDTTAPSYGGRPRGFVSYPVSGGSYKPGDTFSIGRRQVITVTDE